MNPIDWTIFDKYPENTVECRCGAVYCSHTKAVVDDDGQLCLCSRKSCPSCGSTTDLWRAQSDGEEMIIGKKDI